MGTQLIPRTDRSSYQGQRDRQRPRSFFGEASSCGVRLTAVRPTLSWRGTDLPLGHYRIGSAADCDVVIAESGVAANHCTLIVGEHQNIVKAWSPLTWVNDGVVHEGRLRIGDRLILGPIEIKVESLPVAPAVEEGSHRLPTPQELRELLASSWIAPPPSHKDEPEDLRKHELLEELLVDVQQTLAEVIEREHVIRNRLSHDQQILLQRGQELSEQWKELEAARSKGALALKTEQSIGSAAVHQQTERDQFEKMLQERYHELAARASENCLVHRKLKVRRDELDSRASQITAREESLKCVIARNLAQQRQLKAQTQEIARREEIVRRDLRLIDERQRSLEEGLATLQVEQTNWNQKFRSRERLLEELAERIESRTQEVAVEEDRLNVLSRQLSENQAAIEQAMRNVSEGQAELDQRFSEFHASRVEFEQRRQQFQALQTEQEAKQAELEAARITLVQEQEQLAERQAEIASELEQIRRREESVARCDKELRVAETELKERQDTVIEQLQQLGVEREKIQQQLLALQSRENELAERESTLKNSLQNRSEELVGAAELIEEQKRMAEELAQKKAELAAQETAFAQERDALELRQADFDAAFQNLNRLRTEIEAERSRDAYDREQVQRMRSALAVSQEEFELKQRELDEQRMTFARQQEAVQFVKDSQVKFEADRRGLEIATLHELEEARLELENAQREIEQLQAGLHQERLSFEQFREHAQVESQEREHEQERIRSLEAALAQREAELAVREEECDQKQSELERHLVQVEELKRTWNERVQAKESSEQQSTGSTIPSLHQADASHREIDETAGRSVTGDSASDLAALQLRQELASIFGISEAPKTEHTFQEVHEESQISPEEDQATQVSSESKLPVQYELPSTDTESSGEESVESYMQQLLARLRQQGDSDMPSLHQHSFVRGDLAQPTQHRSVQPSEGEFVVSSGDESSSSPEPVKSRNRVSADKEAIRADLNSFRELANYSTRTAVATSRLTRTSAIVRLMLTLSAVGCLATAALMASSLWVGDLFFLETLMVGGVTAMMVTLAGVRYWEVRNLPAIPAPQLDASSPENQKEPEESSSQE